MTLPDSEAEMFADFQRIASSAQWPTGTIVTVSRVVSYFLLQEMMLQAVQFSQSRYVGAKSNYHWLIQFTQTSDDDKILFVSTAYS